MKIALFPQGSCLVLILIILEYIYIKINAQENIRAGVS
ncbi:putative membrane protein [Bacteroides fragilis str. S38L5]|nr:putative membrane protein [Bacteroides fragilis str. S38L5]EYB14466.1 putative membrane protein [Bacteroides fragilis str. S38L3]